MWIFYHNVVGTGSVDLSTLLSIPALLVGVGLFVDTYVS